MPRREPETASAPAPVKDSEPSSEEREGPGVLVDLPVLVIDAVDGPRRLEEGPVALERLAWVGRPVVLVPASLVGRPLPDDRGEREVIVRHLLGDDAIPLVDAVRAGEGRLGETEVREAWRTVARAERARWLITDQATSVAPARRAGLRVVLVGARGATPEATVEPAEHEARDLLDAVAHVLAAETFAVGSAS